jgi:hypothetical protein
MIFNKSETGILILIMLLVGMALVPSAVASTEEQQTNITKDDAQLQIEALEAKLGEEGMKKVADYLELEASLPDVVKVSPYSGIAFAATDKESQVAYLTAIDESDLKKENKEKLKADLQDIWNRYPDKFVAADNLVLRDVAKITDKRLITSANLSEVGIKWGGTPHQDFAYYACDGSTYRNYAKNAADDPDNSTFDPSVYRYYNHYEDAYLGVGGAPDRCDGLSNSAISAKNSGVPIVAHQRFGFASHYLVDVGCPFHSKGALDYLGSFSDALFCAIVHTSYESYISNNWATGENYKRHVSGNSQSITVTDPEQAVEDNADISAQYYDYIDNEIRTNPNWQSDTMLIFYTSYCIQESAKYAHGLYDYIM